MKQRIVKYKVKEEPDGTFRAVGTFAELKGRLRGTGKTEFEAVDEVLQKAKNCFSVPLKVIPRKIPYGEKW